MRALLHNVVHVSRLENIQESAAAKRCSGSLRNDLLFSGVGDADVDRQGG